MTAMSSCGDASRDCTEPTTAHTEAGTAPTDSPSAGRRQAAEPQTIYITVNDPEAGIAQALAQGISEALSDSVAAAQCTQAARDAVFDALHAARQTLGVHLLNWSYVWREVRETLDRQVVIAGTCDWCGRVFTETLSWRSRWKSLPDAVAALDGRRLVWQQSILVRCDGWDRPDPR